MLKPFRLIALVAALMTLLNLQAVAQTYPINNPTYVPTAVLAATTLTTSGTVGFNNNGNGTVLIRIAGTNTGLSAVVQVTESRAASPSWTTVPVQTVGGGIVSTITANGLYRLNINGAAQVRVSLSSITGTNVIVSAAATPGSEFVATLPARKQSYATAFSITPAATPTDFFTLAGSASKTINVTRVTCSASGDSGVSLALNVAKRSAADTGGTSSAATAVALDSSNGAAAAAPVTYTANPTVGALVGYVRRAFMTSSASIASVPVLPTVFSFGEGQGEQPVVLRGAAQVLALNGGGSTLPANPVYACSVSWTEE